jgi:hypothetical protein
MEAAERSVVELVDSFDASNTHSNYGPHQINHNLNNHHHHHHHHHHQNSHHTSHVVDHSMPSSQHLHNQHDQHDHSQHIIPNYNFNYNDVLALYRCPFVNVYNYTTRELDILLTYKHYISGWLCLLVIVAGLVANSITICALLHRYMRKSSTNAYLLALAFSNLCSLVCLFAMTGARFTLVHPYRLVYCKSWYENFINRAIPFLTPVNNLFQVSGIYLIVAVSIDRLVIVKKQVKPTQGNRRRRKMFTWAVIMAIFVFSFFFTLPNWFLYESQSSEINITHNDLVLPRLV